MVRFSLAVRRIRHIALRDNGSTPEVHSSTSKTVYHRQQDGSFKPRMYLNSLEEPPTSPAASCSFRFCPPLSVEALSWIFFPRSQSRSSCSRSSCSSPGPFAVTGRLTALHTRRFCRQVRSSKRTFFCGTMPISPRSGRPCRPWPFAKTTSPDDRLRRFPRIDSV
jgi:hypothetical protein